MYLQTNRQKTTLLLVLVYSLTKKSSGASLQGNIACKDSTLLGILRPISDCVVGVASTPKLPRIEMIHKVGSPLDSCIGKLAYLLTVKTIPASAAELTIEITNEFGVDKVHKSITHITGVIVIYR